MNSRKTTKKSVSEIFSRLSEIVMGGGIVLTPSSDLWASMQVGVPRDGMFR